MKQREISRRDALKIIGAAAALAGAPKILSAVSSLAAGEAQKPNFLFIVFDTLSALNMSLHGYKRKTTPRMEEFAETSVVFHRAYAPSNFTTSSAASLLTGVYPWSHRALDFFSPLLSSFESENAFHSFSPAYETPAYTHNIHVLNIFEQFKRDISLLKPIEDLVVYNANELPNAFQGDKAMGFYATKRWRETFYAPSYSLFLQPLYETFLGLSYAQVNEKFKAQYPLGLGDRDGYLFRLEDAMDWVAQYAAQASRPFFGYFHLLPPHEVYRPRAEFLGMFENDGFKPPVKPEHFFTNHIPQKNLEIQRRLYDEYIAMTDFEFGRLFDELQKRGALDNTYLILTSDHGQLLERGIHGHSDPPLYEPVIRVPLMIRAPGQTERKDVYSPTSLLDILPTFLRLSGQPATPRMEGKLLPGLGGEEDPDRVVFSMHARRNAKMSPLKTATLAAVWKNYKLIQYKGYPGYEGGDELFDLENDPEEMNNLINQKPSIAASLRDELEKHQSAAEKLSLGL